MSRTDVHRPHWVQEKDPACIRKAVGVGHYHWGRSDWDPEARTWQREFLVPCSLGEVDGQCRYWLGHNTCGCNLCVDQQGRKLARRQERVRWRSQKRDLLKTHIEDLEDVDVPFLRGSSW